MKIEDSEIPKYKKKSKKNTIKKSKHKHIYKTCLFFVENNEKYVSGTYCEMCGKIYNIKFIETKQDLQNPNLYTMLTQEEILEKYKNAPKFNIKDTFDTKNVPITNII